MGSRLLAISDLHVAYKDNFSALQKVSANPQDDLILAGDIAEKEEDLRATIEILKPKFRSLFWVPGNHELWSVAPEPNLLRGHAKYMSMVDLCRSLGVFTPEDPFQTIEIDNQQYVVALLFLLYDYSFKPDSVRLEDVLDWALEHNLSCSDEALLHPDPFPTKEAWCQERCRLSLAKLRAVPPQEKIIIVNHFPLRGDLVYIPRIPRFRIWCGTTQTEDWHKLFNVTAVVSGHLHFRSTAWRDGVRFEEVSLGYPKQWRHELGIDRYLRCILPAADGPQ